MTEPRWLSLDQVLWLHALQIRGFGGLPGIRDQGLLESALARVRHRFHYGEVRSIPELAVGYASSISANHPFIDGNKRVAFHCLLVFLRLHGLALKAEPAEPAEVVIGLAAGRIEEAAVNAWVHSHL